jgi:endogenous inhibitor of DNA gyrase (YacG/DUF329 family)
VTAEATDQADGEKRAPCAICGKPAVERYAPFCSRRCADIDLGRWLKGVYAIPAREADEAQEDREAEQDIRGPTGPTEP